MRVSEVVLKSRKGTALYCQLIENSEKPTVVFVHNMYGSYRTFHRHVKLMNEKGYSTVTFDLVHASSNKEMSQPELFSKKSFMYKRWVEQITDVLDSIPGRKVVFSLSGPSISAFIAASPRKDIEKYICDGGPFREFFECTYRMFTIEKPIASPFKRWLTTAGACLVWGPFAFRHLTEALSKWDPKIPVLSIRGKLDPIVHPENIAHVFENQNHINLRVYDIEKGQHLDGLKNFPEEYSKVVLSFLSGEMNIRYS